jgi:2-phospho-L-lactate guanylyltransferase
MIEAIVGEAGGCAHVDRPQSWSLVVPVKAGPAAKSRLAAGRELARAIAADTLSAAARCGHVRLLVIVSADGDWLRAVLPPAPRGLTLHETPESSPGAGLLSAVRDGTAAAGGLRPRDPAAVLLGDLPALTPASLGVALRAAETALRADGAQSVFVPDAPGTGTVLLAARRPSALDPAFGGGSAAEHEARGAVRLDLDLPDLRRDVDTADDLESAARIGLGPRTAAVLDLPRRARTA